ncbi:MAG: diaminopimelate decarboxylase [Alteromonadaceae bacterium]|nr:MAG: diaminopimelate decarboxylase [Alteromonadaceae bacterium]
MQEFSIQDQQLTLESVSLEDVANQYGTPCYVYSKAALTRSYLEYSQALGEHPGKICFAVKSNSNLAVLQLLANLGASFDIVSGGEMERVLRAGGKAENIIFSGVGKTKQEIIRAMDVGIYCFNVESQPELEVISEVAHARNQEVSISIRVNPDVDANTHPYISTGLKENKFGIDFEAAPAVFQRAKELPGIKVSGVDCHIGSQITELSPFMDALDRLLVLIDQLAELSITIEHLDLGGGLGVTYKDEVLPSIAEYIAKVKERLGDRKLALLFEPGRSISANAGALITEVIYTKLTAHRNFAIVDAAMNDNLRPALYQAWQEIRPVTTGSDAEEQQWDIVGPVCETSDFLAKDRALSIKAGDRLALMSAGAYGFTMSSNYNSRGRAAEVLVDGDKHYLIRKRENFEDIIQGEYLLEEQITDTP